MQWAPAFNWNELYTFNVVQNHGCKPLYWSITWLHTNAMVLPSLFWLLTITGPCLTPMVCKSDYMFQIRRFLINCSKSITRFFENTSGFRLLYSFTPNVQLRNWIYWNWEFYLLGYFFLSEWELLNYLMSGKFWIKKRFGSRRSYGSRRNFGSNAIPVLGLFVPILIIFRAMICFCNQVKESLTVYQNIFNNCSRIIS